MCLSLQTSLSLTRNMNVKVAIEMYYIFSKYQNLDTGNFTLTLSIILKSYFHAKQPTDLWENCKHDRP